VKHPRRLAQGALLARRRHHEVALRLLALAVCPHISAITKIFVYHTALGRRHWLQLDGLTRPQGLLRRGVSILVEGLSATLAISIRIDHNAQGRLAARKYDPLSQMLDSIDCLSSTTDQETYVFALDAPPQNSVLLRDLNLALQAQAHRYLGEQLSQKLRGVLVILVAIISFALAHRLRPERFFFLRGGGGGVLEPLPMPASAGSVAAPLELPFDEPAPASAPFVGSAAGGAPMLRLTKYCCPIVHRLVVIQ
jgi:hypothetical protein